MSAQPERAVLIGLDGANYDAMSPLLAKGLLPNLARLILEGARCENAYATYPTLTGSNWATIATGAWPGTHGVTDMSYHVTGEPINHWHSGFTSDAVEAETLWEAAARGGKKSLILKYPGSWPPRRPDIVMIDGGGGRPFWGGSFLEVSHSQFFSTDPAPNGTLVHTRAATSWASLPHSARPPLEFVIEYRPDSGRIPESLQFAGEPIRRGKLIQLSGIIFSKGGQGYDRLALCRQKTFDGAWTILGPGQWSESLELTFEVEGQSQRGALRVVLEHLDAETGGFSLYFSQVYPMDGFTQPRALGPDLVKRFGAYINHPGFSEFAMGWFKGPETFLKLMEYQNDWLAGAGRYLMEAQKWDFFAVQCHCIDFANHAFVPRHGWSNEERDRNLAHLARCYASVDRLVGELAKAAGEEALICVVSDHGATESPCPEIFINPILEGAGLLAFQSAQSGGTQRSVVISRTLAVQQRAAFIYVNLRGREPNGIVPPEKYEEVRDRVIAALSAYREPTTGRNPFSLILRKEDARILGLYDNLGRDIGDIVYALLPEFDHEHGRQLPGATAGGQTIKPLLLFAGPGVKAGAVLERTTWLVDVAPTLAHAMRWPMPSEAEGAVLYQLFQGHHTQFPRPEFMRKQEEHLREAQRRSVAPAPEAPIPQPGELQSRRDASEELGEAPEPIPEKIEGLRDALVKARAEASKWKKAYEQYHRITHGN